jgi:hypothetical protein
MSDHDKSLKVNNEQEIFCGLPLSEITDCDDADGSGGDGDADGCGFRNRRNRRMIRINDSNKTKRLPSRIWTG